MDLKIFKVHTTKNKVFSKILKRVHSQRERKKKWEPPSFSPFEPKMEKKKKTVFELTIFVTNVHTKKNALTEQFNEKIQSFN